MVGSAISGARLPAGVVKLWRCEVMAGAIMVAGVARVRVFWH